MPDIETGKNRADSAARKFHNPRDMGRSIDRDFRSIFRLAGHSAFRKGRLHRGGHTPAWAPHSPEPREIIRTYVKHGGSGRVIEEKWAGMPLFHSLVSPECRSRQ